MSRTREKTVTSAITFPQNLSSATFPAPEESFAFTTTAPLSPGQDVVDTLIGATHDTLAQGSLNAITPDRVVLYGWTYVFILLCQSVRALGWYGRSGGRCYGIAGCVKMYEYVENILLSGGPGQSDFLGQDIGDDVLGRGRGFDDSTWST